MPQNCRICIHKQRPEVESALLAKQPLRNIAKFYGTSPAALLRHKNDHLATELIEAKKAEGVEHRGNLLKQVEELATKARKILGKAETQKDWRTALIGVRELKGVLELIGRLTGELSHQPNPPAQPMFFLPPGSHVRVNMGSVSPCVEEVSATINVSVESREEEAEIDK